MTGPGPPPGAGGMDRRYFEDAYRDHDDPWGFDTSWYERRKYALTLAALPRPRYRRAVEAGCANGALTELLAARCRSLHAFDLLDGPVARARARLASRPGVEVGQGQLPGGWPPGSGDLTVWSEVAYYLDRAGLDEALDRLERWLEPGGDLVAVHWTGPTNYPLSGHEVHRRIGAAPFLEPVTALVDPCFRLDLWRRR